MVDVEIVNTSLITNKTFIETATKTLKEKKISVLFETMQNFKN